MRSCILFVGILLFNFLGYAEKSSDKGLVLSNVDVGLYGDIISEKELVSLDLLSSFSENIYEEKAYYNCPEPKDVKVTGQTDTSVSIEWQQFGSGSKWEVIYVPYGEQGIPYETDLTPIVVENNMKTTISGLEPGKAYTFYVRVICSDGSHSVWSVGKSGATEVKANNTCEGAYNIPVNKEEDACVNFASGSLIKSTLSGKKKKNCSVSYGTAQTDVWFEFTPIYKSHTINISDIMDQSGGKASGSLIVAIYNNDCSVAEVPIQCFNVNASSKDNVKILNGLNVGKKHYVRISSTIKNTDYFFKLCISSINLYVSPSGDDYSVDELVKDVLVKSKCDLVSNVRYQAGDGKNSINSIASFRKKKADFPYDEGLVLATHDANNIAGPYMSMKDMGRIPFWSGDADLNNVINEVGGSGFGSEKAVAVLEFDFIPIKDSIKFEYLFVSESYSRLCGVVCQNGGALFAAWLTEVSSGVGQNLALVPGTTLPIAISTIRDRDKSGADCSSVNPEYYWKNFDNNQDNPLDAPTNYTGITVPMASEIVLVKPGKKYRIKLAIADFCPNPAHASAVFFKGGSFDIGAPSLGEDLTIDGANALCVGSTHLLDSKLNPLDYIFQWTQDGEIIVGENGPTLEVTETGSYALHLSYKGGVECFSESDPVLIEFFDDIIIENMPKNLEACKIEGVNSLFNLNSALKDVTFSQVEYSFHESKDDAEAQIGELPSMYTLDNTKNQQQIWVRIQSKLSYCYRVVSFKINRVACELMLVPLDDITLCYSEEEPTFDIGKYSKIVYHNAPGYKVTFHNSKIDASDGNNAIDEDLLDKYPGVKGEVIWVRVVKEAEPDFFKTTSFKLNLTKSPTVSEEVTPLYACVDPSNLGIGKFDLKDKDREVSFSVSGVQVFYYETEADAIEGNHLKALPSYGYESAKKTIYARVELIKSECFSVTSFELELVELPKIEEVNSVYVCNPNDSGYSIFDLLTLRGNLVLGAFPENLDMSFHSSIYDAELNIKPLPDFYNNVIPSEEIIYVRVADKNSKCVLIKPIHLYVNTAPDIKTPKDFIICDLQENGIGFFDLTEKEAEIFDGLEKENYNILYFSTKSDANTGDPDKAIVDITNYTNLNTQYVWIRVTDKKSGCSKIERIKLDVIALPSVPKAIESYALCDTFENKGFASFDLNKKTNEIIGTNPSLIVEFFETQDKAEANNDPITGIYKNTTAHKQVIFVRVEDVNTKCFVVLPLTLEVVPYPVLDLPTGTIQACTDSDNNVAKFNLFSVIEGILPDFNQYEYTFFETFTNANNNINKISDPDNYNNLKGKVSIWVRIVNKKSSCVAVYELQLETVVAPKIPLGLETIVLCDTYENVLDGRTKFDLTFHDDKILADQPKAKDDYKIEFYTTEANAEDDENKIIDVKDYVNFKEKQTIWVRLTDIVSGCFSVGKFDLQVNVPLGLVKPDEISTCNSDLNNGGIETFDLTIREKEILGGLNVYGTKFEYYETKEDALDRVNQIKTPEAYKNKSAAQSIWVVVENEFGCVNSVLLTIRVFPLPKPNMELKALVVCEATMGSEKGNFNLHEKDSEIRNGDDSLKLSYYVSKQNALDKENPIEVGTVNSPENYESASKTVYVRVETSPTHLSESCFVILELELRVNSLPFMKDPTPFAMCLVEKVEFYEFDLESIIPNIRGKYDKDLYSVMFYVDKVSAEKATDPLPLLYTNVEGFSQTIFVRLENIETGCYSIKPLIIQIEDIIYSSKTESPKVFCDDNDGANPINDGFTTIDLTAYSEEIIGEDNIVDVADLEVQYYASEADLELGNQIENPSKFVNTSSPQKIIAVVKQKDKNMYCKSQESFEIIVHKRPEMLPIEGGYVCENFETKVVTPFIVDSKLDSNLYEFVWYLDGTEIEGAKQSYYEAISSGEYTVSTIDKKTGCASFGSASATVTKVAAFMMTIEDIGTGLDVLSESDKQNIVVNVESLDMSATLSNYEFALNDGDYQSDNIFYDVAPGEYIVWVRDVATGACSISRAVSVINYPKYFTPNGDGFNDTWNVRGLKDQPNAKIYVFDRYGKLLKQLNPSSEGWDGTFEGRPMPSTDYWFSVEYNDYEGNQKRYKGHFTLKR